jgi:hypothetical protein
MKAMLSSTQTSPSAHQFSNNWYSSMASQVVEAVENLNKTTTEYFRRWDLALEGPAGRRLLISQAERSPELKVSFEVAFELFEGDVHHHIEPVGNISRERVKTDLAPLVYKAFHNMSGWKPSAESILASLN